MNEGRLSQEALRGWVANRFYYQRKHSSQRRRDPFQLSIARSTPESGFIGFSITMAPAKMKAALRRGCAWARHAAVARRAAAGATSATWSSFRGRCLCEFRSYSAVADCRCIIAHGTFRTRSDGTRLAAFEKYYSWIDSRGLDYFRRRVTQARRDSDEALAMTLDHCNTPELQREAVRALEFKCDVLWSMLDAIHHAYGSS
jgi:pyrroloquinoline-quinone synthase